MKIPFLPKGIDWQGEPGENLMTIAAQAGIVLDGSCGGKGLCGKCEVFADGRQVLACQSIPQGDTVVEIPRDDELVARKIRMSNLPTDYHSKHASSRPEAEGRSAFGIAFDIGTTTVMGALYNLQTSEPLGVVARTNPQGVHGADVVSRIQFVAESAGGAGLEILHKLVINCMDDIATTLLKTNDIAADHLDQCVVCGNTTMCHLVAGEDPSRLAFKPFKPAYTGPYQCLGKDLGFSTQPAAAFYIITCIAGHVGADITADLVALRERLGRSRSLMIDIGTNGEIFACSGARRVVCSTAAGPAFEGATIKQGMRAAEGAIERVDTDASGSLTIKAIGDAEPIGICGSGIIDAVAMLIQNGIVDSSGRFVEPDKVDGLGLCDDMSARVRLSADDGCPEFVLYWGDHNQDVVITQRDVREVQLGKGAVAAGTTLLLHSLGITASELDHVFIAGAFGNYINLKAAQTIGLIPDCDPQKVEFVGNTAIVGAVMVLLSDEERMAIEDYLDGIDHVELAEQPDFMNTYIDALSFGRR